MPLDDQSSRLTTISTLFGLFRYTKLPFGVKTSPAIFQNFLDTIMFGFNGLEIYQDNLYIHGKTKGIHDERLQKARNVLNKYNLRINGQKSQFSKNEINILGAIVNGNSIKPDKQKLEIIEGFQKPNNTAQLQITNLYIFCLSLQKVFLTQLCQECSPGYCFLWLTIFELYTKVELQRFFDRGRYEIFDRGM